MKEPTFTLGIEEEYLLVERESRELIQEAPAELFAECETALTDQVTTEFLQSQIEVGTRVCGTVAQARNDLAHLRRTIARLAEKRGLAIIAASTHPSADWVAQRHTDKDRYHTLARDMQALARRLVICGMHVHVCIDDEDLRIDLLSQSSYILPHLLAYSTSSPFWHGQDTGLKSYRLSVWDAMPRTGLPEHFESWGEYQRHLDVLIRTGVIEDATKVWWDVRPSARFPTLEMRITDVCTRLEDAICLAAVFLCWLHFLYRLRLDNQRWRRYSNFLLNENRWMAQRYGFEKGLIDFGKGKVMQVREMVEELLNLIRPDAEHFGCLAEVEHVRTIVARGTSADWQVKHYRSALAEGASPAEALNAVVDMLIRETTAGLESPESQVAPEG
jgi:carboxylate-amine ligase